MLPERGVRHVKLVAFARRAERAQQRGDTLLPEAYPRDVTVLVENAEIGRDDVPDGRGGGRRALDNGCTVARQLAKG